MNSILKTYDLAYSSPKPTCFSFFRRRLLFLMLFTICIFQSINALESINELERNSRIILVHALGESEGVLKTLRKFDFEIYDRDIYWFVFIEENIETNYKGEIQENFHRDTLKAYFSDTETNVVLIGKDGYIKQKSKQLDLKGIFDLIDIMPMRQMEIREIN